MSGFVRWLRRTWGEVCRRGWNRLPGVRWLARIVKELMFKLQYRGRTYVRTPDGIKLTLQHDPENLIKWDYIPFILSNEWQPPVVALFRSLEPGENAIDVGAAFGYLTLLAARAVGPGGRVFSFEPEAIAFKNLEENLELNRLTNVLAMKAAVTDHDGASIHLYGAPCGATVVAGSAALAGLGRLSQGTVPAVTLDGFLASRGWPDIRLMKFDIEGGEVLAFRGMTEALRRNRAHLMVIAEFGADMLAAGGFTPEDFLRPLLDAGYVNIFNITGNTRATRFEPARDVPLLQRRTIGNTLGTVDLLFLADASLPIAVAPLE